MKKILPLCSLICLFSGVAYSSPIADFVNQIQPDGKLPICNSPKKDGKTTPGCWYEEKDQGYCKVNGGCEKQVGVEEAECVYWGTNKPNNNVVEDTKDKCGCAAKCCKEGFYLWISIEDGCRWPMGICYSEEEMKGTCKCGTCPEGQECKPNIVKLECGMGFEDCSCQPIDDNVVVISDDPKPSEKCPDGTTGDWPNCVCLDENKKWDKDKKECVDKPKEECYWEAILYVDCSKNEQYRCNKQIGEGQKFPITEEFKEELKIKSCDDLKQKFREAKGLSIPVAQELGANSLGLLELENKICKAACGEKPVSDRTQVNTNANYQQNNTPGETWPSKADIDSAKSVLDAAFSGEGSVWKDKEGKFNKARLASDLTAGVVLGTVGGVVSGVVIKKKQIEKGFEALHCTVGGQKVADWGDEFMVGFRR